MGLFSNKAKKAKHADIRKIKEAIRLLEQDKNRALENIRHQRELIFQTSGIINKQYDLNTKTLDRNYEVLQHNIDSDFHRLDDAIRLNQLHSDIIAMQVDSRAQGRELRAIRQSVLTKDIIRWTKDMMFQHETNRMKLDMDKERLEMEYQASKLNIEDAYRKADLEQYDVERAYQEKYRQLDNALSEAWSQRTGGFIGNILGSSFGRVALGAISGGASGFGGSILAGAAIGGALSAFVPPIARMVGFSPEMSNFLGSIGVSGFQGIFDFSKALAGNVKPALNVLFSAGGSNASSAYTSLMNAPSISDSFSKMMASFGKGSAFSRFNSLASGLSALSSISLGKGKDNQSLQAMDILSSSPRSSITPLTSKSFDLLSGLKYPSQYAIDNSLTANIRNAREVK